MDMLFAPPFHGAAGAWDEIIFSLAFVIALIIFVALAFLDRKRDPNNDRKENQQDEEDR